MTQAKIPQSKQGGWKDLEGKPFKKIIFVGGAAVTAIVVVITVGTVISALTNTERQISSFQPIQEPEAEEAETQPSIVEPQQLELTADQVRLDALSVEYTNYVLTAEQFMDRYAEQRKIAWINEARAQHSQNKDLYPTPASYLLFVLTGVQEQLLANNIESVDIDSAASIMNEGLISSSRENGLLAEIQVVSTSGDNEAATVLLIFQYKVLISAINDVNTHQNMVSELDTTSLNERAIAFWQAAVLAHDPTVRERMRNSQGVAE